LKGEQKRRGEAEKEGSGRDTEAGETEPATTLSVAEKATSASAGDNGACSDGRGGENKRSSSERDRARKWNSP